MWSTEFYKRKLSEPDQRVYEAICSQWLRFQNPVVIKRPEHPLPDYSAITAAIHKDHPEIFWVDFFSGISITTQWSALFHSVAGVKDTISCSFYFSDVKQIQSLQQELNAWQQNALHHIPANRDDRNKLWILYDFLARGVTYRECGHAQSHTILGCFHKNHHEVVCQGIAMGMKFLSETFRIPCIVVNGSYCSPGDADQGLHAWNIFSIGNQFRHLDATAELQHARMHGSARDQNAAMTDAEAARMGYSWDRSEVPACRRS